MSRFPDRTRWNSTSVPSAGAISDAAIGSIEYEESVDTTAQRTGKNINLGDERVAIEGDTSPLATTTASTDTTTSPKHAASTSISTLSAPAVPYPWLLSTDPPRKPRPTLWTALRDKHMLQVGTERAQKHLVSYDLSTDFPTHIHALLVKLFATLSNPTSASREESLYPLMMRPLARRFCAAHQSLTSRNETVTYTLKPTRTPPNIRITSFHFTYGPYPPPPTHVPQTWVNMLTLLLPREDSLFVSQPRQKQLLKKAESEGCYMNIDVQVSGMDLEFVVKDENGIVLVRDKRDKMDLQVVSPHFTPWDEIFELEEDGGWRLRWEWRISDVDCLLEAEKREANGGSNVEKGSKAKIDWLDRNWGG
ncbi:hypothetical protein HDV05_000881 [Chytridiales sp. JEL 0842]|nr:hypothetical protein HDV05_000881 [Chytridiales sp. JEL 0842]